MEIEWDDMEYSHNLDKRFLSTFVFRNKEWFDHPDLWLRHELKDMEWWIAEKIVVHKVEWYKGELVVSYGAMYPDGYWLGKIYTPEEIRRLPPLSQDDIYSSMFDLAMTHSLCGGFISRRGETMSFTVELFVVPKITTNITPEFIEELSNIMKARKNNK